MPAIKTWLPVTGKLISREGHGRGDPDNPVRILNPFELYPAPEGTQITLRVVEADWDNGQVYVEIEAPQSILDWLAATHGVVARPVTAPLSSNQKAELLASQKVPPLIEDKSGKI